MILGAEDGAATATSLLDILTPLTPALLALAGVWLGSRFARGREDRSWRRSQLVDACSDFIRATSAVEQWATSDQFAARLGAGQYPTDYKEDLEKLDAAVAVLSISTPEGVSRLATDASQHLRDFLLMNARHQGERPKGNAMEPASYQQAMTAWRMGDKDVETAQAKWKQARAALIAAIRHELDALH